MDNETEILKLLEQEYRLYVKLANLSIQLKSVASTNRDLILMERLLSERVFIITEIERLSENRKGLTDLSIVSNDKILELSRKIRGILNKLIECEKECERQLIDGRNDIGEQLVKINKGFQLTKTFSKGFKSPSYISIKL